MTLPQPLSHSARSARVAGGATQPLCQSGWRSHSATLPEWLEQPLSHSATLPEWLEEPLSHSARVAGAATQPLCHSARVPGAAIQPLCHSARVAGAATQPLSHSARVAGAATQPLRHSEWLSGWVAATPTLAQWLSGWGENFRYCAFNQISPLSMESKMCILWTQTTTLSWRKAGLATLARWSRCWLATKRDSYKSGLCDSVHDLFRLTPHVPPGHHSLRIITTKPLAIGVGLGLKQHVQKMPIPLSGMNQEGRCFANAKV